MCSFDSYRICMDSADFEQAVRDIEINWPRLIPLLRGMLNEDFQGNKDALACFLQRLAGWIENDELPLPPNA